MSNDIVPQGAMPSGALTAEHYQSFEVAKANDSILGSTDIAEIRSYAAYARAQAQAIHKTIAATNGIDDVTAIKQEALETEQTFAKVGLYADQRIGELLRNLEQAKRGPRVNSPEGEKTKTETIEDSGMSLKTAYQLEQLAANPDVVQAVLDRAEAEGRVASRKQVLDAIKERDQARKEASMAEQERDAAEHDAAELRGKLSDLRDEVSALERQNDRLYEQASAAQEPQVIERTVEVAPADYDAIKRERDLYLRDLQRMRKSNEDMRRELDKAEDMLGMDKTMQDVRRDVQYLISATNTYVRQYGGLTWTAASFEQVDAAMIADLHKAAINLATFANALVASLENNNA